MKYLAICRNKDLFYALPPETRAEIRTASIAFVDECLKSGKCEDAYYLGDMKGSVTIWELGSSEEAARVSLESPMAPFQDIELIPIIEYDVGKKAVVEVLGKAVRK